MKMKKTPLLSLFVAGAIMLVATPPSAIAGPFHGVVAQGPLRIDDFRNMGDGNVGTLRQLITWQNIEASVGAPNWERLDILVGNAAANGVRVLPILSGPGPTGTRMPPTNRYSRNAFARFAGAMANRYGRGGTFWRDRPSKPITAWQIFNEQNGPTYWRARPNPRAYAKLLKATSKKITRQDGRAEIVLGGMFGSPSGKGAIYSWAYLNKLYRLRGVKKTFDTVAVHPYSPTLRGVKYQIAKMRKVMRRNQDGRTKMRITEFGWGSSGAGPLNKTPARQARLLKRSFGLFEDKRRAWKMKGANWFSWQDDPTEKCYFCPYSGLFYANRDPKPAWSAFKSVAR